MKRIFILTFVLTSLCGFAQSELQNAEFVPDEIVIRLKKNSIKQVDFNSSRREPNHLGLASVDAISDEVSALKIDFTLKQSFSNPVLAQDFDLDRYFTIKIPEGADLDQIMQRYRALGEVELVEPNYIAKKHLVPNDPLYGEQWGLNNTGNAKEYNSTNLVGIPGSDINVEQAWDIHTGGSNVTIAIIDEGVDYNHPEFAGRMVPGYDFFSNDSDPFDEGGHGTACAGIAAAAGDNGIGVAGVSWGTLIMPLRALGPGGGSFSDIADAIIFAVDNGADVISMSLGGGSSNTVLANAVSYAYANDVLVFASRGNGNNTADNYPSSYTTVISVGGLSPCNTRKTPTSCDGEFWWGASYGGGQDRMDFVAPAARITTTDITGSGGYSPNAYTDSFNGTSSACPYAAGVGALIRSYNPALSVDEIRDIMRQTSVDIGSTGYDAQTGFGKIDAYAALLAATACSLPAPTNFNAFNIGNNSFNLSWNAVSGASSYTVTVGGSPSTVTGTSISASGLTAGTSYTCTVVANCSGGGSGSTSQITVTTTGTAPITCSGTVSSYPYNQGFESGVGWTQASGDDGNWFRTSGSTPSSGTGPTSATQGSFYLFLEASTNGSPGQIGNNATAILEGPCLDLAGESSATFSFENHMYGTSVGSLAIEAATDDNTWTTLWSQSGNQGNQWNAVDVSLDTYVGGTVKLRIVGTTGNGWSSDIAIDNLTVTSSGSGGCSQVTVNSNDFESGWGIWNDGGSDARRSSADAAYSNGTFSIRLRDNTSTSTMTTDNLDLSAFEDLTVSFSYLARSMDNVNEDFWLQVSTNGGSSFTTVEEWNLGDEFVNNVREDDVVTINGPFSSTTQLRFRCDASGNSDWVYIDDVVIAGCSNSTTSTFVTNTELPFQPLGESLQNEIITIYPNPVLNEVKIKGVLETSMVRLMTMSGQVLEQGIGREEFNMSGLNSGIYLIQLITDGEVEVFKIVKK